MYLFKMCGVFMLNMMMMMIMMMVVLFVSLAAIRAWWIASKVELWLEGWTRPMPSHVVELARPDEPKIMSFLCVELQCSSFMGHVRGEE